MMDKLRERREYRRGALESNAGATTLLDDQIIFDCTRPVWRHANGERESVGLRAIANDENLQCEQVEEYTHF